jgi:hypothetical protein
MYGCTDTVFPCSKSFFLTQQTSPYLYIFLLTNLLVLYVLYVLQCLHAQVKEETYTNMKNILGKLDGMIGTYVRTVVVQTYTHYSLEMSIICHSGGASSTHATVNTVLSDIHSTVQSR